MSGDTSQKKSLTPSPSPIRWARVASDSRSGGPERVLGRYIPNPKLRFLDQCREVLRFKQMAARTEESYVDWIRRFIVWSGKRHPKDMGTDEVRGFLTHLAAERNVAAATQNQALNAIVFLYREVLNMELGAIGEIERPTRLRKLPTVLTKDEVRRVLAAVVPEHQLACQLLYGTGMRLLECLRLRVKDVDFERNQIVVHSGRVNRYAPFYGASLHAVF